MDFLRDFLDIRTLQWISGSGPGIAVRHEGTPVFISGRKVILFNIFDAFEMALKDELLATIPEPDAVEIICDLMMNDFVRAKDEAADASEVLNWFTVENISAACMMEIVLPMRLIGRLSSRMQCCLKRLCNIVDDKWPVIT